MLPNKPSGQGPRPPTEPAKVLPIPSPCISICEMDASTGLCKGCLRSLDEIARWSAMDEADKQAVWELLTRRKEIPQASF